MPADGRWWGNRTRGLESQCTKKSCGYFFMMRVGLRVLADFIFSILQKIVHFFSKNSPCVSGNGKGHAHVATPSKDHWKKSIFFFHVKNFDLFWYEFLNMIFFFLISFFWNNLFHRNISANASLVFAGKQVSQNSLHNVRKPSEMLRTILLLYGGGHEIFVIVWGWRCSWIFISKTTIPTTDTTTWHPNRIYHAFFINLFTNLIFFWAISIVLPQYYFYLPVLNPCLLICLFSTILQK